MEGAISDMIIGFPTIPCCLTQIISWLLKITVIQLKI